MKLSDVSCHVRVPGYIGSWNVVETAVFFGQRYFLVEHDDFFSSPYLILDEDGNLVREDVWNGFDDFEEFLVSDC